MKLKEKLGLCTEERCIRRAVDTINIDINNYQTHKHLCKEHSLEFSNKLLAEKNNEIEPNISVSIINLFYDVILILIFLFCDEDVSPLTYVLIAIIFSIYYWLHY